MVEDGTVEDAQVTVRCKHLPRLPPSFSSKELRCIYAATISWKVKGNSAFESVHTSFRVYPSSVDDCFRFEEVKFPLSALLEDCNHDTDAIIEDSIVSSPTVGVMEKKMDDKVEDDDDDDRTGGKESEEEDDDEAWDMKALHGKRGTRSNWTQ